MQGLAGDAFQNMAIMEYAPADFPDSEDTRPPESYLDSGSQSPATIYSSVINNALQRHVRETRDRHTGPVNYQNNWKKKIRDVFLQGNETTLAFLTKTTGSHPTIGQVENLIRRFSRNEVLGQPNQLLKDLVGDLSGVDATSFLADRLRGKLQENPIQSLADQVRELYEVYRELMEKIAVVDMRLRQKLNILDKVQPRLVMLLELGVNETTTELQAQIETYLTSVYQENCPEPEYKELLILYKKLLTVRDLVQLLRLSAGHEKEPICGICLNDVVTHVLVPCGHTYCDSCVRRQARQCFVCRQGASQAIRVFFT
jgi:hypothetical protein